MVDLDSNPTKLIEIVEIGKQLLITRGSLTTFSIANDIAKYFAIIPAMFAGVYAGLDTLNIMRLASPESAILSAVIFNALIIIGLIPLALRGVRYTPASAGVDAAPQPRHLRPRRHHRAVRRHQAHRPAGVPDPRHQLTEGRPTRGNPNSPGTAAVLRRAADAAGADRDRRARLPPGDDRPRAGRVPGHQANGSMLSRDGKAVGSDLIGQAFTRPVMEHGKPRKDADGNVVTAADPAYFQSRPSAAGDGLRPAGHLRLQPRAREQGPRRRLSRAPRQPPPGSTASPRPRRPRRAAASGSGLDPDISPAYAAQQVDRVARVRGLSPAPSARWWPGTPRPRCSGSSVSRGQRARAQPGARRRGSLTGARGDVGECRPWGAASYGSTSVRHPGSGRPTRCSTRAAGGPSVAPTSSWGSWRPTAAGTPPSCSRAWRSSPAASSPTAEPPSPRWTSTPCWPATPRWRWSTSSRTPTSPARGTRSAGRTSRSCSPRASRSSRR